MATYVSDQLNTIYSGVLGGSATAGLAGGPNFPRATEVRGILKVHRFTVELATTNVLPGGVAGNIGNGDTIVLAWMTPVERIYFGRLYVGVGWGAGVTLAIGKLDKNNSSNTDTTHYKAATAVSAIGAFDLDTNMTEQVGADPIGDLTAGNLIPMFGSDMIWLTATVGGGTPNQTGTLIGYIHTVEEGN